MEFQNLSWPLMSNNITADDRHAVIDFLKKDPILTNGPKVREFEEAWSKWLGVKYSVFVNSGASANLLTMAWLKNNYKPSYVMVPAVTWVSDIASVFQNNLVPFMQDIEIDTLAMNEKRVGPFEAVFLTHLLGLSAFKTVDPKKHQGILIEDCCECHGATYRGRKLGTFGVVSNFSFYFAHHLSTIEGGMICTDDENIYEEMRTLRSHGLLREMKSQEKKDELMAKHPEWSNLQEQFIFLRQGYNVRSTEINAVIGLNQLKRLDEQNEKRRKNFEIFLNELPDTFQRDFHTEGMSPYALILIQKDANTQRRDRVEKLLAGCKVEFRRGLSGGGNQLRQPYLKSFQWTPEKFPNAEFVSDFSWYIGNYADLQSDKISQLCKLLRQC